MARGTMDYPLTRHAALCPLCDKPKGEGLMLVCWPCYRAHDMRNGNPEVTRRIEAHEARLASWIGSRP
jgi:hypothetical protein